MPEQQQPETTNRPPSQLPDRWTADLNPDWLEGQNSGANGPHPEKEPIFTADNEKYLHNLLKARGFTAADLKAIPIVPDGSLLEEGATYIDLLYPERGEFKSRGDIEAQPGHAYVAKSSVDYLLWNRLRGVTNPERLDRADDSSVTP